MFSSKIAYYSLPYETITDPYGCLHIYKDDIGDIWTYRCCDDHYCCMYDENHYKECDCVDAKYEKKLICEELFYINNDITKKRIKKIKNKNKNEILNKHLINDINLINKLLKKHNLYKTN